MIEPLIQRKPFTSGSVPMNCFPGGPGGEEFTCQAGVTGWIPGSQRSPGEGNGKPLQLSCLGNPRDLGVWWTAVHGIARVRLDLATKPPPCLTLPRVLNTDRLFTVPACCLLWGIHTLFYKVFTHTDLSCKAGWVVPKHGHVRVGVHAVFRVPSQLPWCRSTSI